VLLIILSFAAPHNTIEFLPHLSMEREEYNAIVTFLKSGVIPKTLHGWDRQNWRRSIQDSSALPKYLLGFEENSTYHKTILKIRRKVCGSIGNTLVELEVIQKDQVFPLLTRIHCLYGHPGRD
jgi:hypothetical protein